MAWMKGKSAGLACQEERPCPVRRGRKCLAALTMGVGTSFAPSFLSASAGGRPAPRLSRANRRHFSGEPSMATTTRNHNTVVGVFDEARMAQAAVEELRRVGFREDQI